MQKIVERIIVILLPKRTVNVFLLTDLSPSKSGILVNKTTAQ